VLNSYSIIFGKLYPKHIQLYIN